MLTALKKLTTVPSHRDDVPETEINPHSAIQPTSSNEIGSDSNYSSYNEESDDIFDDEMNFDYSFNTGNNWYTHKPHRLSTSDNKNTSSFNMNLGSPPEESLVSSFEDHNSKRRRKSLLVPMAEPHSPINVNAQRNAPVQPLPNMMPLTPPEIKPSFPGKFSIHKKPSTSYFSSKKNHNSNYETLPPVAPFVDRAKVIPQVFPQPKKVKKPGMIPLLVVIDSRGSASSDTSDGHYDYRLGEKFADRYTIIKLLGQGTFGRVFQVFDDRTQKYYALKVIKSIHKYREASKIELRVLVMLNMCDPYSTNKCVNIKGCFDYRNHVCILIDLHDISVYDFLKGNEYMAFPKEHVKSFAYQLLKSVAFIHSIGLIHTDLKPENVLLASSKFGHGLYKKPRISTVKTRKELINTDITVIDFGSAVFADEYHPEIISTRHYRAPEVVLGTGWSYPCDMWSIGCLLVELFTGKVLFETRDDLEHLHMMEIVTQCKFPTTVLSTAAMKQPGANLINVSPDGVNLCDLNFKSKSVVDRAMPVSQCIKRSTVVKSDDPYWVNFFDLVSGMLTLDPNDRISADEALKHPWFSM